MTSSFKGYLKLLFAVLVWGVSFVATKIALQEVSPTSVVWLRFGIGVVILGAATIIRKEFRWVTRKEFGYFALLGFIGITFHQWLQSTGLITAQAITTAWIITTTPIFISVLGWFFLKEELLPIHMFGIGAATAGVLLVLSKGDIGSIVEGSFGSFGDLLVFISAPNWAIFSVISRKGLKRYTPTFMMFYVMVTGWLFTSILFFGNNHQSEIFAVSVQGWYAILFLGICCSGLAYIFWYDALKILPASSVGSFLYLEPIAAILFAALLLNETVLISTMIGGLCIFFGVWLVNKRK